MMCWLAGIGELEIIKMNIKILRNNRIVEYAIYEDKAFGVGYQQINCAPGEYHMGDGGRTIQETIDSILFDGDKLLDSRQFDN